MTETSPIMYLVRLFGSLIIAAVITFSLYFGMQLLILSGESAETEDTSFKIIDTRIPPRETEVIREEQQVERPETVEAPEPPKMDLSPTNVSGGVTTRMDFKFDAGGMSTNIDFNAVDRDVQPIMRIEPEFNNVRKPESVTLQFDVTPAGTVNADSIQVLDSTNRSMERPAVRAVRRWKYRPKVVKGEPVWQYEVRTRFVIQPPE